jgi:hypothetical protein
MDKIYKSCQSCGMPFSKDPQSGGTETDGSKSRLYCSFCYENGQFTRPDFTARDMKQLVKGKLQEMGYPGCVAGFMCMGIPRLERWKKH